MVLHNISACTSFLALFWLALLLDLFISTELFLSIFGSPLFALLSATHVFAIPLSSWELIPLWVVCKRSVGLALVSDYLFVYL